MRPCPCPLLLAPLPAYSDSPTPLGGEGAGGWGALLTRRGCFPGILPAMTEIFNRRDQTTKRQGLRGNAPEAEARLWERLRGKQVHGAKFRRQVSVGVYVLDFYCPALKLAVEVDGPTHKGGDTPDYDAARQAFVETLGIVFVRVGNAEVYTHLEEVVGRIAACVKELREGRPPPCE